MLITVAVNFEADDFGHDEENFWLSEIFGWLDWNEVFSLHPSVWLQHFA